MPHLTVNGVSLNYALEGSGPPVVLLHDMGLDLSVWDTVAAGLADRYVVLRPDLRGHGRSEICYAPYGVAALASDLHELLAALGLAPVVLVGHGLGAAVALEVAARYAGDADGLIVAGVPTGAGSERAELADLAGLADDGNVERIADRVIARWQARTTGPAPNKDELRDRLRRTRPRGWAPTLRALAAWDPPTPAPAPRLGLVNRADRGAAAPLTAPGRLAEDIDRLFRSHRGERDQNAAHPGRHNASSD